MSENILSDLQKIANAHQELVNSPLSKAIRKANNLHDEDNESRVVFWLGDCWQVASLKGFLAFHDPSEVEIVWLSDNRELSEMPKA